MGMLKVNKLDSSIFSATDNESKNYLEMAREYAIREAQRATFHEASTLADALSSFSRTMRESNSGADKAISALIEGIVPFKKTSSDAKCFLDKTNLSNLQKAYLWKKINSSWKSNPY